ncbi:MAG: hypothetical protein JNL11_10660 [Bdellovibrionaceae bacterium]|nr:hypothetical protein [Pseudobdellovibrionaceae bacterium]
MENSDSSSKNDKKSEGGPSLEDAKGLFSETLKKVFTTGVSAAFMTEESIRSYLQELKLPKEILNVLIQSANKSKDEITQRVSKEIIGVFNKIDWISELGKFAETHKFKISAEIDIIKKEPKIEKIEVVKPE